MKIKRLYQKNRRILDCIKKSLIKTHHLRSKPIKVGDWVLVIDSSLEHQLNTLIFFAQRWFGPYVVIEIHDNATYSLRELDDTRLMIHVVRKRVKTFRRRDSIFTSNDTKVSHILILTKQKMRRHVSKMMIFSLVHIGGCVGLEGVKNVMRQKKS